MTSYCTYIYKRVQYNCAQLGNCFISTLDGESDDLQDEITILH